MARGSKSGWQENGLPRRSMVGKSFGRLTVIEFAGRDTGKRHGFLWRCKCLCGGEKVVETSRLNSGNLKSCGCLSSDSEFRKSVSAHKEFGEALRNKVLDRYKRNARKRSLAVEIPDSRFFELFSGECFYCGCVLSKTLTHKKAYGSFSYNGVDRLDNSIGYVEGNVVSCCADCNYKKGDQHF